MKIVLGYDGAAAADAALRDLERAGLPADCEAVIVFALPPIPPQDAFAIDSAGSGWLADAYVPMDPLPEQIRKAEDMAGHAKQLLATRFPAWTLRAGVEVADPAGALLRKAESERADLIVVGSRGWTWLGRAFLGSVAQKVLTHAKANVRLAQPRPGTPASGPRILAAIDGSRDARLAMDEIVRRSWPPGTRVRLVAAKETYPWADALAAAEKGGTGRKAAPGSWAPMERILEAARARLREAGLDAEWEIMEGDARNVLLTEAESYRADCLFMGRRGMSGFNRLLLGSVSAAVASHAPCSVEVIRKPVPIRPMPARARKAVRTASTEK